MYDDIEMIAAMPMVRFFGYSPCSGKIKESRVNRTHIARYHGAIAFCKLLNNFCPWQPWSVPSTCA